MTTTRFYTHVQGKLRCPIVHGEVHTHAPLSYKKIGVCAPNWLWLPPSCVGGWSARRLKSVATLLCIVSVVPLVCLMCVCGHTEGWERLPTPGFNGGLSPSQYFSKHASHPWHEVVKRHSVGK